MAEIKPSYDANRTDLRSVIPLLGPYSITIEPTRMCNLKCFYCMHSTRGIKRGVLERAGIHPEHMDINVYEKIVREIMEFPVQPKRINFSGMGEPLMNPRLGEMIRMLRNAKYKERIDITTNGVLLTPEKSTEIVDAGITRFIISVQGLTRERYNEISNADICIEQYIDNIRYLFNNKKSSEIYVKIIDASLKNDEEKERFYEMFDGICDTMFVEHLIQNQQLTAEFRDDVGIGTDLNLFNEPATHVSICPVAFYTLQVSVDGSVSPCAPGAGLPPSFSFGNCKSENSLNEIWNGSKRNSFLKNMLKDGISKTLFCDTCDCHCTTAYENIDDYADELLARLETIENG